MKTKLFTLLFAITVSMGTILAESGTCGDNLIWDYQDGVLTISGTGAMNDYSQGADIPWYSFRSSILSAIICNGVTSIGGYAFDGCSSLIYVTIPNSVTSIGSYAFYYCINLTSVNIPNSVTSIGEYAFFECRSLTSVTIPNSVTSIGNGAFYMVPNIVYFSTITGSPWGARSINGYVDGYYVYSDETQTNLLACSSAATGDISIPNSVTSIGDYAFNGCSRLTNITIPNSVTSIGIGAFNGCNSLPVVDNLRYADTYLIEAVNEYLSSYSIKEGTKWIGSSAFYYCINLTSVNIPNSVTNIEDYAFDHCSGLTSVNIPNSVTSIGSCAFRECGGLTSIDIPSTVTSIGSGAFTNVNNIVYSGSATGSPWKAKSVNGYVDGYLVFENNTKKTILGCSTAAIGEITIPNSVTSIGSYAFYYCINLTSVNIPNSVTRIGECAFNGCSGLTSVIIPHSVTSIERRAFYRCSSLPVVDNLRYADTYLIEAVDKSLSSYSIKEGTKWIGSNAFDRCGSLTSVNIPNSVTNIEDYAFDRCGSLTSVNIPNSVTSIESGAFSGCSSLTSVTLNSDSVIRKAHAYDSSFRFIFGNQVSEYIIGNSVTSIGSSAFYGCSNLTSVTIPNSVTSIGSSAFYGCSSLTSVTIPNSVTSIGSSAFYGCSSLTSVTIPNSVTSIGAAVFSGCSGLVKVILNCNTIISQNFTGSNNINSIFGVKIKECVLGDSITSLGNYAFYQGNAIQSITIGKNITSIGNNAFNTCSSLISVSIGNSVTSIGDNAFKNCSSLTSVILNSNAITSKPTYTTSANIGSIFGSQVKKYTIGDDVTTIGKDAFYGCSQVTNVSIGANVTSIGNWAFQNCSNLDTLYLGANITSYGQKVFAGCPNISAIYNYRERPAKLGTDAFKDVDYFNSTLYVLAGSVDMYKSSGSDWKDFYFIEPIGAKQTTTEDVVVTPHDNTADIVWPATNGVNSYSLTITDSEGNQICTLTFNANGQLVSLAFHAPARNNAPQQQTEQIGGFQFTITGLDAASRYSYTLLAKDIQDQVIETYAGTFATNGYVAETFTIRFVNWDGTELQSSSVEEGTIPVYNGEEPTRAADDEHTYTFTGWTPELVAATENVTYIATFETHPIATAIDNISTSSAATKLFRDGQIVILRGDKVYTLTGQLTK